MHVFLPEQTRLSYLHETNCELKIVLHTIVVLYEREKMNWTSQKSVLVLESANIVTWLPGALAATECLRVTVLPYWVSTTERKTTRSKHGEYLEQSVVMPH